MATKKPTKKAKASDSFFFRSKYLLIAVGLVLFSGVGAYYIFFSKAAAPVTNAPAPPSVYFSPTSQSLGTSASFTVDIMENSGTTAINAVQTNFTYDATRFTYVSTDYTTSAFDIQAEQTVDSVAGTVRLARAKGQGATVSGPQLVGKMTFTTKTVGGAGALTFTTGTALVAPGNPTNLLPGSSAYGNASFVVDTTAPTTAITAPTAGANVELGSTQTITATATDTDSDITKVEFYVDGTLKSTDTTSPYSYAWPTTGVSVGSHSLTTKAYDTYNNTGNSTAVSVNVRDSTAPTVSITAPTAGSTLSGTVSVNATAADNTGGLGLSKVEFYVDNVLKSTDTASPYTYSWDTKTATDATHSLTAKAYDNATTANIGNSTAVSVTVDNADHVAPSAPANLRATANTFTSISLAWDASTDNVGVTGYTLSRNGSVIYSGTALSYTDNGGPTVLTSGTTYTYTITAKDAANNTSTATTLNTATKTQKVGDINGDDAIDIFDLSSLLAKWGTTDTACDLNKSGTVEIFDLSILLTNWGK